MSEIKNIPKHWEIKKLGEVCEKVVAVKRKEKNPEEEFLYLDIGGIDNSNNKILTHKNYKWKDAPSRAQQIVFMDDVLFSTVRTYMKNIAIVEKKMFDGQIASSGFAVIRGNKKIVNSKFIFYYSLSQQFLQPLNELQTGSSYPAVRDKDVFSQPFPLPPLPEQQAIVAKIEELLSELDNGKQQLQTAQQQLKVYRQSLLKWAFEGIREPKSVSVEHCCSHIVDCLHSTAKFASSGFFCIDTTCIENGKILFNKIRYVNEQTYLERISRLKPEAGDILFAREGTVGTTLIVPDKTELCLGQRMMMFRLKENITSKYFMYYFQSSLFKSQYQPLIMGTTAPHLNIRDVKKFNVVICSLEEQQLIVSELESKLTVCDKIEETISQSLQQAETLRQSILKKAFEGKLI